VFGWGEFGGVGGGAVNIFKSLIFAVTLLGPAQVVQIGPKDPHFCEKVEKIKANLILTRSTHVQGSVHDQTATPFRNSTVLIRTFVSERRQIDVKSAKTDVDGHFDLGEINRGRYRLLASPTRAFSQPTNLTCGNQSECSLSIELTVNPTDLAESVCPIK
jgi:hypothetical protein